MQRLLYLSLAVLFAGACKQPSNIEAKHTAITGIDSSKKPGNDFFAYVNSIWYDSAQIPASQTGVGSYSFLNYPQRIRLQGILDSISGANNQPGKSYQVIYELSLCVIDKSTKRSSEDTWLKVTKTHPARL